MKRSNDRTRVAVAGIGGRGSWAAKKLAKDDSYDLVALCDINIGKLSYFREKEGFVNTPGYASIAECLKSEELDAVVVTTHDSAHAEVVIPALEAGKYVFVEKPLDVTAEKCRAIVDADEKAGGRTFVGFNLRFAPVYAKIKSLIDGGAIGDVLTIQADEFYDGGRTYFRRWNRLREFGGGLWITKASHDFDLLYWLAGAEPISVYALARLDYYTPRNDATLHCRDCTRRDSCHDGFYSMKRRRGIEGKLLSEIAAEHGAPKPDLCLYNSDKDTFDHGIATVEFERGILATYTCNVVTGFTCRRIRVSGTKGTLDGELGGKSVFLRRRDPPETEEIILAAGSGGHGGADDSLYTHFHDFTKGRREPKVRPSEAMIPVLMGLGATRSGDEGRSVSMSEFGLGACRS